MGVYKEKREQTKNILIDSFWELYELKSIDKITVKELTDKAGYNRTTFYIHFNDVYDILQYIENLLFETFDKAITPTNIASYPQEVLLKSSLDIFTLNEKYYRILLSSNGDPYFVMKCKEKLKELFSLINKPEITLSKENTDFDMEYITSGLLSCISYWFEKKPFSKEELLVKLTKLISRHN